MKANHRTHKPIGYEFTSPEDFVTIWQRAKTFEEVVQLTGASRHAVRERARSYREHGVKLKDLLPNPKGAGRPGLDVAALNVISDRELRP